jgi:hypothetical protein
MVVEMLVWHDETVRESSADISVFDQTELCRGGPRYDLVHEALSRHSPAVAKLFERLWDSPGPSGCPRLSEWAAAMATVQPVLTPTRGREGSPCPGCDRPVLAGQGTADHAPTCPLRAPTTPLPMPDRSAYPGVPTHTAIGFVPLFDL